jgi:HAMP domain-containing protein
MITREELMSLVTVATAGDGHERSEVELAQWWDRAIQDDWHLDSAMRAVHVLLALGHRVDAGGISQRTPRPRLYRDDRRILTPDEARIAYERREEIRRLAQAEKCEDCGAPAGEPCRGFHGQPKIKMDCWRRVAASPAAAALAATVAYE